MLDFKDNSVFNNFLTFSYDFDIIVGKDEKKKITNESSLNSIKTSYVWDFMCKNDKTSPAKLLRVFKNYTLPHTAIYFKC